MVSPNGSLLQSLDCVAGELKDATQFLNENAPRKYQSRLIWLWHNCFIVVKKGQRSTNKD